MRNTFFQLIQHHHIRPLSHLLLKITHIRVGLVYGIIQRTKLRDCEFSWQQFEQQVWFNIQIMSNVFKSLIYDFGVVKSQIHGCNFIQIVPVSLRIIVFHLNLTVNLYQRHISHCNDTSDFQLHRIFEP